MNNLDYEFIVQVSDKRNELKLAMNKQTYFEHKEKMKSVFHFIFVPFNF